MNTRILIILLLLFTASSVALGQVIPSASQLLKSDEKKLQKRVDSASSAQQRYVKPGAAKTPAASKVVTGPGKRLPGIAATSEAPEPLVLVPSLDHASCKGVTFIPLPPEYNNTPAIREKVSAPPPAPAPHVPFLTVHGNVLYNLNYYSQIDTPFNESNIYQHTIQTWLDILIKGEYPFRIYLTNHFSNSALFRNYSDFNLNYSNRAFNQLLQQQIRREFLKTLPEQKQLDSLQGVLNKDWAQLHGLETGVKNPALIQKEVEAREAQLHKPAGSSSSDSSSTINKDQKELDSLNAERQRITDSLQKEILRVEKLLSLTKQKSQAAVGQTTGDIDKMENPSQLQKELHSLGMSDSSLPKGYKTLMAIKSFNIGRTVVNYSELSAKNISVNGVQGEYNPGWYYAGATGTVDYRFRDFLVQQPNEPRQYLNILRVGKGLKDGNSVIVTWFTGKRQLYNAGTTTDTTTTQVPSASLMGLTVEGNYHLNKNILLTAEVGKSSSPSYSGDSTTSKKGVGAGLFQLGDHSNEAWSLKAAGWFPATQTRVKASYKHLSANYQSFSIFTDGSSQSAWSVNVDQLLFKKQLDLNVGANTNDYSNPLIGQEYSSTTVFKSVQATWRRRNWPTLSVGYFPSSQLTKLGSGQYLENEFYTMVGNMTHSYSYHQLLMTTAVVYTRFYNRSSDSGFTYFNTENLLVSQTLFLGKFTVQGNASAATNTAYQLYTLEGKVQQQLTKFLRVGAGVKYNEQTVYTIREWGYSAELTWQLKKLGQLQCSADKGYIPGMNKMLVPDNTGRLTYLKTF